MERILQRALAADCSSLIEDSVKLLAELPATEHIRNEINTLGARITAAYREFEQGPRTEADLATLRSIEGATGVQIESLRRHIDLAGVRHWELWKAARELVVRAATQRPELLKVVERFEELGRPDQASPDAHILKIRAVLTEIASAAGGGGQAAPPGRDRPPPSGDTSAAGQTPMMRTGKAKQPTGKACKLAQKRIGFLRKLESELTAIKLETQRYCTIEELRLRFRDYTVWREISEAERDGLLSEGMKPKELARTLSLRHFGIQSGDTLKRDQRILRRLGR